MKSPKYTDLRYPNGYVPAARTNVAATFRRIRAEQKAAEAAAQLLADAHEVERLARERAEAEQAARNEAEAQAKTVQMRKVAK